MGLNLQECIDAVKKEYPDLFPYAYIEVEGKYVFNLIPKGQDPKRAISDMHVVDPANGYVSGGISIMEFLKDPGFREAWKKPNLVANHDESIGHSAIHYGWKIRKNQNGSKRRPFERKTVVYSEDELTYGGSLMHYGIKGQKWGVRRFQYENGSYTEEGKVRYGRVSSNDGRTGVSVEAVEAVSLLSLLAVNFVLSRPKVQDKLQKKRQLKFDEKNKAISEDIIGDIAAVGENYSSDHMPPTIKGSHSIEDDMAECNPRYNNGVIPGTSNNCTLCAFTYDLRRRGYDVMAMCSDTGNFPRRIVERLYSTEFKEDKISALSFNGVYKKAAQKYPEGARGEIAVYNDYSGHSMAWEIKNGELVIIDPQRNVKSSPKELSSFGFNPGDVKFIRTDNLQLNPEGIQYVSAAYKPGARKILKAERGETSSKRSGEKKLSEAERRKKYEEQYLKDHPNADKNGEGIKNWVDAQMNE